MALKVLEADMGELFHKFRAFDYDSNAQKSSIMEKD
jgi:hypothetical protein